MRKPITPAPPKYSQYGVDPKFVTKRMAELDGITSLSVKELFPDLPDVIYPNVDLSEEEGLKIIDQATRKSLENVDMSMIKEDNSVNICASHHGFTLLGGAPYAQMLKTIRDVVEERTGSKNIRLRAGVGMRLRETEEYIKSFGLDEYFGKGKARGVSPIDEGIPIETEIGTLYGIKAIYDADFIIHAHNSDVREVHFHRQVDRAVKPFGMSYARAETRSTYHQNLGPRGANFTARSIFNSDFVQSKFAFATFLDMSPGGVVGVISDNDLYRMNEELTYKGLKYYGKMITLFGELSDCIVGLDFPCPVPYVFASGVIYANFVGANVDAFDLRTLPPYTWYTESFYDENDKPLTDKVIPVNPKIRMVVQNYAWGGYPSTFFVKHTPTIVVGREQADVMSRCPMNINYMDHCLIADKLDTAMDLAYKLTNTDKVVIFDGASTGINVSESMAEEMLEKAKIVSKKVDEELMPLWLKQRGLKAK